MRIVLGIICILFGGIGWGGQVLSSINYLLAQKLGLQEKSEVTDPLFRSAEINAARWDSLVLWMLWAAGVLMLINHPWWQYLSLIAGGIYLDTAGREAAKLLSLSKEGIKIGSPKDLKIAIIFFFAMFIIAIWAITYSLGTMFSIIA